MGRVSVPWVFALNVIILKKWMGKNKAVGEEEKC